MAFVRAQVLQLMQNIQIGQQSVKLRDGPHLVIRRQRAVDSFVVLIGNSVC